MGKSFREKKKCENLRFFFENFAKKFAKYESKGIESLPSGFLIPLSLQPSVVDLRILQTMNSEGSNN